MTEDQRTTLLKNGDKAVFRQFYTSTHPRLLRYVQSRVKAYEDAEEIVQDTYLSFLDALPLFRGKASLWTFLVSIARHEIADYFRRLYAKKALKYVPFIDQGYVEEIWSTQETREYFDQALQQLLPEDRQIIMWKYDHKLSLKDIAERLQISHKAAESRLFRARKAFQLAYVQQQA